MLAITLSEARTIAIGLVVVFAVAAVLGFWILKSIFQKLLMVGVLALFGFAVWTQRASLQDCADKVMAAYEFDGVNPTIIDTDCSFFGTTITISDPRDSPDENTDAPVTTEASP
ncbi:hypothetical protein [Ilumatobacter nonamiensis]|uniref:hypothetical protein n=1 Tax=Ilumatobacter nonamiensis TaxID=467093 RepID=UPI00058D9556|nr:hypothetical protein [Ilumatobacter nonamiensis]